MAIHNQKASNCCQGTKGHLWRKRPPIHCRLDPEWPELKIFDSFSFWLLPFSPNILQELLIEEGLAVPQKHPALVSSQKSSNNCWPCLWSCIAWWTHTGLSPQVSQNPTKQVALGEPPHTLVYASCNLGRSLEHQLAFLDPFPKDFSLFTNDWWRSQAPPLPLSFMVVGLWRNEAMPKS